MLWAYNTYCIYWLWRRTSLQYNAIKKHCGTDHKAVNECKPLASINDNYVSTLKITSILGPGKAFRAGWGISSRDVARHLRGGGGAQALPNKNIAPQTK